ncbi:MAG: glycosyltransferase [Acidobacteriota bacterium]|nr:glycosyltransferase [Acidobacteriota bacterium]
MTGERPGTAEVRSPGYEAATPEVSVVVATRDRARFLDGLLEALAAQRLAPGRFEVVVVDDASTDGTWAGLGRAAGRSSLPVLGLRLGRNVGQGAARTAGVARARGAVVAITDDDCLPTPQWLEQLLVPLAAVDGRLPAVVVQGRTEAWPADRAGAGAWARTVWVLGPTWLFETCNIAYRRADLLAAGGFPGRLDAPADRRGKAVGEDALAGWRVVDTGARLVYRAEALVHHRNLSASYPSWLASHWGKARFPALVRRHRLGRRALSAGVFLGPRTAALELALAGAGLGTALHRPWLSVAAAPWLALAWPEARSRPGAAGFRLLQLLVGDLVGVAALAVGSVRHRRVVL